MATSDDDRLMQRLACGDLDALAGLIDRHQSAAIRYCTRTLADYHVAEEVAQEGFLRLVAVARDYQASGRFVTFLYKILTNLCIDELRRRNQRKRLALPRAGALEATDAREVADPKAFRPDRRLEGEEDVRRLWREVDELPPDQRAALLLRELEGKSYAEIAEILGKSLDNVKVMIHRARRRLLETLQGGNGRSSAHPSPDKDASHGMPGNPRATLPVPR